MAGEVWIDASVVAAAAAGMGLTETQALAWYQQNAAAVRLVRDYVARVKSPTPEDVETNADPNGPMDPELVQNIGALLAAGGLILRMSES